MTRENLIVRENLKFELKEFQFVMSLKNWRSIAYTVFSITVAIMTSYEFQKDVIGMSFFQSTLDDNSLVAMVTDL